MRKIKKLFTIVLASCMACLSLGIGFAAIDSIGQRVEKDPEDNPENHYDTQDRIIVTDNDLGGKDFEYYPSDIPLPQVGEIQTDDDYMYVFGYKYTSSSTDNLNKSSLTGWTRTDDDAWGCAAIDKTKETYDSPLSIINRRYVTYMTYAFANCRAMTSLPLIDRRVIHNDYMCLNCTGLTAVEVTTISDMCDGMFNGCANLQKVYLGKQLTSILGTPFLGATTLLIATPNDKSESVWGTGWNKVSPTEIAPIWYNAKYIVWQLPYVPVGTAVYSSSTIYVSGYKYIGNGYTGTLDSSSVNNETLWQISKADSWGATSVSYGVPVSAVSSLGGIAVDKSERD